MASGAAAGYCGPGRDSGPARPGPGSPSAAGPWAGGPPSGSGRFTVGGYVRRAERAKRGHGARDRTGVYSGAQHAFADRAGRQPAAAAAAGVNGPGLPTLPARWAGPAALTRREPRRHRHGSGGRAVDAAPPLPRLVSSCVDVVDGREPFQIVDGGSDLSRERGTRRRLGATAAVTRFKLCGGCRWAGALSDRRWAGALSDCRWRERPVTGAGDAPSARSGRRRSGRAATVGGAGTAAGAAGRMAARSPMISWSFGDWWGICAVSLLHLVCQDGKNPSWRPSTSWPKTLDKFRAALASSRWAEGR